MADYSHGPMGAANRLDYQRQSRWHARVASGQIIAIDPATGIARVRLAKHGDIVRAHVPLGGLSLPRTRIDGERFDLQGVRVAFMRFMPDVGSYVTVEWAADDEAFIIGYTVQRGNLDAADAHASLMERAQNAERGLRVLRTLQPGEWDMRSSGGAEAYGARSGNLTLAAGGLVRVRMSRTREEWDARASLFRHASPGVDVRWGQVRVRLAGEPAESAAEVNPASMPEANHFRARVGSGTDPAAGGPLLTHGDFEVGDIRDAQGAPVTGGPSAQPLRVRLRAWGAAGDASPAAAEVNLDILGNLTADCAQADVTTTGFLNLNAGGSADQSLVRGDELLSYLQSLEQWAAAHVHPTALGPSGPSSAPPPTPPASMLSALGKVK